MSPMPYCWKSVQYLTVHNMRFYVLFNSSLVISGQWLGDNERLCEMEPCLQLKRPPSQARFEPVSQRLTY